MSTDHIITTKRIVEMSQYGAAITGDLEEVLLHDTTSILYKEHLAMLVDEVERQVDLENLATLLQTEKQLIDRYEEQELAEKTAYQEEKEKQRYQAELAEHEKKQHTLSPTKIVHSTTNPLPKLAKLLLLNHQITQMQVTLQQVQVNQQVIQNQWQLLQQQQATQFIQAVNGMPVLLPNGQPVPAHLTLQFDPNSHEALELQQRLAAAPMMTDLLNTLEKSDMREIYDKQVLIRELQLKTTQPELADDGEVLELMAKQQAVKDLNLDLRQLQNKFLLSITAIHGFMKRQDNNLVENLVEQYNQALGIDINATPHKKVGIYKILDRTISPFLAPRLTMDNRKKNHAVLEDIDQHDLQVQAMKGVIQENHLQKQSLMKLSSLRSLVASLRHVASENAEFSFLNDICDRVIAKAPVPNKKNHFRLVPKGYNIK
jgi:hypothetical protein